MVVHHPLSGRTDAREFHLHAGRLCVMLSRHRVACFVVARRGVEEVLRHAPAGDRILGLDEDPEYAGWRSHFEILDSIGQDGRVVALARLVGAAKC